jgi:signal transduction histidine kinase
MTDYQEISRIIVASIANAIDSKGVCLLVKSHFGSYEIAATQGIFSEIEYRQMLMNIDVRRDALVEFPNLATSIHPDLEFIIPLRGMQEEIGELFISGKESGEKYSVGDMYLLQEIIDGATASLERTLLIRDVSLRDTFVSIASHELRSPLTAIMGYTDLLREQDPPEEVRKKWLQCIADCNQRLYGIVDELLNVSRIQSGRTILKLDTVNTRDILQELVLTHSLITNKHRFVQNIQDKIPGMIAEYDKIRQVLDNLVSNAIKYSPGGGTVTITASHDEQQDCIVISIADQGIGIGLEDRLSLFTTFHRIQRPETRGIPGTGLGLYIVKNWIEAMGGRVWLESELNKGSVFSISIPAAAGETSCDAGGLLDEENTHRGR